MLDHAPRLDAAAAARLARELYGVEGAARALTSERDQNFRIEPVAGAAFVLKIANARETAAMLEAQQRAMEHLATRSALAPRVLATRSGATLTEIPGAGGRRHRVWAVSLLPGVPLSTVRHRSPALLEALGGSIGALSRALADFDHPAIHREFHWDLARGRRVIAEYRPLVDDPVLGAVIDALAGRFDRETAPLLTALRRSAMHHDLNDNNVLVAAATDLASRTRPVTGIVDFGDMVHGYTVADLAVAAAYVMLDADDPLAAAAALVRGAHAAFPLSEAELAALFGLIVLRLCTSACVAAHQRRQRPDNDYLDVSQSAIRRTLPVLARDPLPARGRRVPRRGGVEPVPTSAPVTDVARGERVRVRAGAWTSISARAPCVVLDLGVGSPLVSGDATRERGTGAHATRDRDHGRGGARVGIGRYDEPRLLYTAPFFAAGDAPFGERRTIHIGLDLFADAGTPVHAPLDGDGARLRRERRGAGLRAGDHPRARDW